MSTSVNIQRVQLEIDPQAVVQRVDGPQGMSILVVKRGNERRAFLNDCADEHLPLDKDDFPPVVNSKGQLICLQHGARFDACQGCLIDPGQAHHAKRLKDGLTSIPLTRTDQSGKFVELAISADLIATWRRIMAIRARKSFGRGLGGACRFWFARLVGRNSKKP